MSMTTISVKTFLRIAPKLPASDSIMLRGIHGIGKSQLARQLALIIQTNEGHKKYPVIDRRLSQQTEGDIIGLPSTDGEVTRFNPPSWYKQACDEPVFLFLDELNRATPEVMQAAFQIVLDRELNGWKLHPQTRVMTAINSSAAYNVNEIDPALLDRFWARDLVPDVEDWLEWGNSKDAKFGGDIHYSVLDFIRQNEKWLDPPKDAQPGDVNCSRRSWEKLDRALKHAGVIEEPKDENFYQIAMGYVGTPAAIAFTDFAKSIDNQVTGEEIVNGYKKVKAKVNKLGQERQNIALEKAAEYVVKLDKVTDKQGENLRDFMHDLPGELRIALWTKMTQHGIDKLELAKSVHKYCAEKVLDVFGVPMGDAGVGVVPNIPGIFKQPAAAKK